MPLTIAAIKALKPGAKTYWEVDGKVAGLGVMVLPSGTKTWYLRHRLKNGRQQTFKIGRADIMPPELAREIAIERLNLAAKGEIDEKPSFTIAQLRKRMEKECYWRLSPRTRYEYTRVWNVHIEPAFAKRQVRELDASDVSIWFNRLSLETPYQANRCLAVLNKAMRKAMAWNLRERGSNPCEGLEKNREGKRMRYLTSDELARLWQALDSYGQDDLVRWRFAQLIKLLLLTGCRISEVRLAKWDWVDMQVGVLTIPAAHHKTGNLTGAPRRVQLPDPALAILRELRSRTNGDWLIEGTAGTPFSGVFKAWKAIINRAEIENLRPHDLRHSFASFAITEASLTLAQVGGLLGHQSPLTTARYAHLIENGAAQLASRTVNVITGYVKR